MTRRDAVDYSDPRSILEAEELDVQDPDAIREQADNLSRIIFWILEGKGLVAVATRAYVAAHVVAPDVVAGITLQQISSLSGAGPGAAQGLAREFEGRFGIRSIPDRRRPKPRNFILPGRKR